MPPPGATDRASQSLFGDHSTAVTGSSKVVTRLGHPPSIGAVQTCGTPLMSHTKARRLPSGENVGEPHRPMRAMRVTASVSSSGVCAAEILNDHSRKRRTLERKRIALPREEETVRNVRLRQEVVKLL